MYYPPRWISGGFDPRMLTPRRGNELWRPHSLASVHALPTKRYVFFLQLCSGKFHGLYILFYVIGFLFTGQELITVQESLVGSHNFIVNSYPMFT